MVIPFKLWQRAPAWLGFDSHPIEFASFSPVPCLCTHTPRGTLSSCSLLSLGHSLSLLLLSHHPVVSDSSVRGFQAGQLRNAFLKCPFLSVLYAACMWVPTGQGKVTFHRAGETGHELPSVGAGAKLQSSRRQQVLSYLSSP